MEQRSISGPIGRAGVLTERGSASRSGFIPSRSREYLPAFFYDAAAAGRGPALRSGCVATGCLRIGLELSCTEWLLRVADPRSAGYGVRLSEPQWLRTDRVPEDWLGAVLH
jgi:hypothetical protein